MTTTTCQTALSWADSEGRNHIYYQLVAQRDYAMVKMMSAPSAAAQAPYSRALMRVMTRMGVRHLAFARDLASDPNVQALDM